MLTLRRKPSWARTSAERLHAAAVARSRSPALYACMGAPDTVEGRFEVLVAHVVLLLDRLKGEAGPASEVRQGLFDAFVSHLDGAMREMGVGDLAMAKRMRKLGEAIYGRLAAYGEAFERLPHTAELEGVVARTILDGLDFPADALARDLAAARARLAGQSVADLIAGAPAWEPA